MTEVPIADPAAETKPESTSINLLKVRDDRDPVTIVPAEGGKYKVSAGVAGSWADDAKDITLRTLRERIEPWLTSLFQSEHLSLLIGSGLTHAVHYIAAGKAAPAGMSGHVSKGMFCELILEAARKSAELAQRNEGNIEDEIRVVNELLRGFEIIGNKCNKWKKDVTSLSVELMQALSGLAQSILESERGIGYAEESKRTKAFETLVAFLMSFASRTGTRDRLNIFTTNYDRLIEAGADMAGLHLLDRVVGNLTPIFRSSRLDLDMHYNPPGIRGEPRYLEGVARFTKLHGSVDWVQVNRDIRRIGVPFGAKSITPYLEVPGLTTTAASHLMIFPNAAKDRETSMYPYVELFRDLAAAVCRPNSTLVTYGFSFGDEHINRVVRDMLTIPSTHLVVVSRDDSLGRIQAIMKERKPQVSLLVGPQLADLVTLTENFLPKAAIDKATFRMAELLKQRLGTVSGQTAGAKDDDNTNVGSNT